MGKAVKVLPRRAAAGLHLSENAAMKASARKCDPSISFGRTHAGRPGSARRRLCSLTEVIDTATSGGKHERVARWRAHPQGAAAGDADNPGGRIVPRLVLDSATGDDPLARSRDGSQVLSPLLPMWISESARAGRDRSGRYPAARRSAPCGQGVAGQAHPGP